jgi:HK97 gp10 family phage protein
MRITVNAARGGNTLQGIGELKRDLAALGDEVATRIGRRADRKAADALAEEVRRRAPHRPGVQLKNGKDYGDLKDNIRVRLRRARKEFHITYTVDVGQAFWAFFLEFGTATQAAQPFMRPAFEVTVGKLQDIQIEELRAGITRAAKRIRNKQLRQMNRIRGGV